jgi:hypothetical protein
MTHPGTDIKSERARDRALLRLAMTQNNLGIALATRGSRMMRLEEAVAAYDAALEIFGSAGTCYYIFTCRNNRDRCRRFSHQFHTQDFRECRLTLWSDPHAWFPSVW